MSHLAESSSHLSSLRERATGQLTGGVRSDLAHTSTSEAMAVLYKLASLPSTAGDALALLHELQVHQVEVDMQHEELRHSRADLENHLARQTNLVERAPAAFLVIDETTVVCEINRAGFRLLGAASHGVLGQSLASFLTAASNAQLQSMLAQARAGAPPQTCELHFLAQGGVSRTLLCTADKEVSSGRFILVLMAPAASG